MRREEKKSYRGKEGETLTPTCVIDALIEEEEQTGKKKDKKRETDQSSTQPPFTIW